MSMMEQNDNNHNKAPSTSSSAEHTEYSRPRRLAGGLNASMRIQREATTDLLAQAAEAPANYNDYLRAQRQLSSSIRISARELLQVVEEEEEEEGDSTSGDLLLVGEEAFRHQQEAAAEALAPEVESTRSAAAAVVAGSHDGRQRQQQQQQQRQDEEQPTQPLFSIPKKACSFAPHVVHHHVEKTQSTTSSNNNNNKTPPRTTKPPPSSAMRSSTTAPLRGLAKTMSIMAPRITNPTESAVWENMVHHLEHKINKLEADGNFHTTKSQRNAGIPWYAPPLQRQRWGESTVLPHINFGDLFFDLFYVAAVYNLGVMLITAVNGQNFLRGIIYFLGMYGALFVTWETEVFYSSRYTVVDYTHRLFEMIRFVLISTVVLNIQPIELLSNPFEAKEPLVLTLAICLESLMHLALNLELYYYGQGDHLAIQIHTLKKIYHQLVPTSLIYLTSVLVAAVMYFGNWSHDENNTALWQVRDLPLTLIAVGYLSNVVFTTVRKMKATSGFHGDIRDTYVPNDVDYIIQRYGDWTMLMVGEVVMALAETTDSERNYLVASIGTLTLIVLHCLNRESAPGEAHGHALWRNIRNATCFGLLMQVLSISLVVLGVSYKIFMTDDHFGIDHDISASLFCGSLAASLLTLELMLVSHRGIKRTFMRLFRSDAESTAVVNWGLAVVTIFKFASLMFLVTLPLWEKEPNVVTLLGFFVVTAMAVTRVFGWAFVFREEEIKAMATKAAQSVRRGVSFAVESVGGSMHGSERSFGSFGSHKGKKKRKKKCPVKKGKLDRGRCSFRTDSEDDDADIEAYVDELASMHSGTNDGSAGSYSLQKREDVYDEMFDAVVLTDLQGDIVTVNRTTLDTFGYESKNELIGENVSVLVGGDDAKHHDKYMSRFHEKGKESSQIGRQRVLYARRKDGSEFPAIVGIKRSSNRNYLVGYIRDMSLVSSGDSIPQLQITNLGSLDKRVQRVLDDNSFDCIVVINPAGIIQGVNATLVTEFGYESKADLVGENMTMLMGGNKALRDHHPAHLENFYKRIHSEGKDRATSHVVGRQRVLYSRRKDGSEFRCIIGVHEIEGMDMLVGFIRNVDSFVESTGHLSTPESSTRSVMSISRNHFCRKNSV